MGFFFFLNFSQNRLFRPFRPIRPIPADSGRYGRFRPIQARVGSRRRASKPCRLASARVGENHVGSTWPDAAGRAGSGVPCASPRPAASDAGAAPPVPRPCFPGYKQTVARVLKVTYKLEEAQPWQSSQYPHLLA